MTPGLTDEELDAVERRFGFRFNDHHRELLSVGLPTGPSWPDWRHDDEMVLRSHLGVPARTLMRDTSVESSEIARAPRMIPVFGYAFTPEGPGRPDAAVWALGTGASGPMYRAADDLAQFVDLQLGRTVTVSPPVERLPFWDDLADGVEPGVDTPADLGDVRVPPFPPDRPPATTPAARPPRDPGDYFAARGVELGPLTRHDNVLAHRAPLWTTAVAPERAAATWETVRGHFSESGLWPVLITDRTWYRIGADGVPDDVPVLAAELNGAAWLSEEYQRRYADDPLPRGWEPWTARSAPWESEWAGVYDVARFVHLALVPTPAHWLVPGLLQWSGAVNYDVLGVEHASVLRRWAGRWGTELLALDDETAVLRVADPPTLDDGALEAAVEAYLYCPDAIDTNPDGVDALAPSLTRSLWVFWWD